MKNEASVTEATYGTETKRCLTQSGIPEGMECGAKVIVSVRLSLRTLTCGAPATWRDESRDAGTEYDSGDPLAFLCDSCAGYTKTK
jgi:hypothetical protein